MNWMIKTLVRAMVAGVGWKLGTEGYEALKRHLKEYKNKNKASPEADENGAPAQAHAVEITADPPEKEEKLP